MNCHEVNSILDAKAVSDLDAAEKGAIEHHFEFCAVCRNAWMAFADISATEIPKMSDDLVLRVAREVAVRLPSRGGQKRRALLAGSILVVGAAAASIALRVVDREPEDAASASQRAAIVAPMTAIEPAGTSPSEAPADDPAVARSEPFAVGPALDAIVNALDPRSVVIVIDDSNEDPGARATLAECHQGVVDRLSAVNGLNVISGEQVAAFQAAGLANEEIARALGAGAFLALGTLRQCSAGLHDARTGGFLAGQGADHGGDWTWQYFYDKVAEHIGDKLLTDEPTLLAEAQAAFLNPALGESERLAALGRTSVGNSYFNDEVLSTAVIAGLSQIMTSSTDAEHRRSAVLMVRGVTDPALVDPLLYALVYDDEKEVRRVAASTLHTYVDEPRVRDALSQVVAEDPNDNRSLICCRGTLAEAARRSLLSDDELRGLVVAQMMNPALTDLERLEPLVSSLDGRGLEYALDADEASVVFEIGRRSDEAAVRSRAWSALRRASNHNASFVPTLLDDLENHTDDGVRQSAANALTRYVEDPAVRSSFERVVAEDTCDCVRRTLNLALEGADGSAP